MFRFTTKAKAEGRDSNPHTCKRTTLSTVARPPVSGSRPYEVDRCSATAEPRNEPQSAGLRSIPRPTVGEHRSTKWTRRELNPDYRYAIPASYPLDHRPDSGIRSQKSSLLSDSCFFKQWNRRELNSDVVCARHNSRPRAIPIQESEARRQKTRSSSSRGYACCVFSDSRLLSP